MPCRCIDPPSKLPAPSRPGCSVDPTCAQSAAPPPYYDPRSPLDSSLHTARADYNDSIQLPSVPPPVYSYPTTSHHLSRFLQRNHSSSVSAVDGAFENEQDRPAHFHRSISSDSDLCVPDPNSTDSAPPHLGLALLLIVSGLLIGLVTLDRSIPRLSWPSHDADGTPAAYLPPNATFSARVSIYNGTQSVFGTVAGKTPGRQPGLAPLATVAHTLLAIVLFHALLGAFSTWERKRKFPSWARGLSVLCAAMLTVGIVFCWTFPVFGSQDLGTQGWKEVPNDGVGGRRGWLFALA